MRKELEQQLYTKYPKIFIQVGMSKYDSCMYWGIATNDGWYNLIDELCGALQTYLDEHPEVPQVIATQVKEKFGVLCFYTDGGDEATRQIEIKYSNASESTCEKCGSTEEVTSTRGWITNLCKTCMVEHNTHKLAVQ